MVQATRKGCEMQDPHPNHSRDPSQPRTETGKNFHSFKRKTKFVGWMLWETLLCSAEFAFKDVAILQTADKLPWTV